MKKLFIISLCLMSLCVCRTVASVFVPADDQRFTYMGRVSYDQVEGAVAWTYPGVQIQAVFSGTSVSMKTNPGSGFYIINIDDRPSFKIESGKEEEVMTLATDLPNRDHRLTITYAIEGHAKKPVFYGLYLDDGCTLMDKPVLPERKIEFIGNSITCGYGIEGNGNEKSFYYRLQNFCLTYAYLTAKALNAQYHVVARSGIGFYRNYMGKIPDELMPKIYPHTMYVKKGELWDFSRYCPDVVCVALGTNDTTGKYTLSGLIEGYKRFLNMVREQYSDAKIVLLSGPMLTTKRREDLRYAQETVIDYFRENGDSLFYRFEFQEADKSIGMGSQGHPNAAHHAAMAEKLIPYLRQLMNW